jgi:hypothetical protein
MLTTMLAAFSGGIEYPLKLVKMMLPQPAIGFSKVAALTGLGLYLVVGRHRNRVNSVILPSL